jgi:single stranded DNA-binding protein
VLGLGSTASKSVCTGFTNTRGTTCNQSGFSTETGEKRDETEFHRIVAWDKLAEARQRYLKKGRKVHVEGRLQTRPYMTFQCSGSNGAAIESSTLRTIKGSNSLTGAKSMSGCCSVSWV